MNMKQNKLMISIVSRGAKHSLASFFPFIVPLTSIFIKPYSNEGKIKLWSQSSIESKARNAITMVRISTLILLVTFSGFPKYTCEVNDKSIHKGHMVFVGGELVGGITILKSAVYKRGHIKLHCCSECLREVECSGIRIDFNSSSCSLLKGQFSALEQPMSSSQIFMVRSEITWTLATQRFLIQYENEKLISKQIRHL